MLAPDAVDGTNAITISNAAARQQGSHGASFRSFIGRRL
jgi:hypothetical protein